MKRREAILGFIGTGVGLIGLTIGYKWWELSRSPDLHFLENNVELIDDLAETIIPATDSPGAKDAHTGDFIVKMIRDCTPRHEQNLFIDGLKDLRNRCMHQYHRPYSQCSTEEKQSILHEFERKGQPLQGTAGKVELRLTGRSFFTLLKSYTVQGYCTSQIGATRGLAYQYVPGSYQGCIPLTPGQRTWATN